MININKYLSSKFNMEGQKTHNLVGTFDDWDFQSRVITSLRFPLIVLIVLFHLYEPGAKVDNPSILYHVLVKLLGADGIAKIAVPTFFLISGYLFFFNIKEWNLHSYRTKLKKRCNTLLVPYILWNAIPIILGVILCIFVSAINGLPIFERANQFLDSVGWFDAFWNISDGHPYIVPLWYVRDLMVCCIIAPLIFILIKYFGLTYLIVIGICFLADWWFDVPGLCIRALFFFSLGAYFSINRLNMVNCLRKVQTPVYILALSLLLTTSLMPEKFGELHIFGANLFILFGIWALFNIASLAIIRFSWSIPMILTNSVFFIFAFHVFPLPIVGSVLAISKNTIKSIPMENMTISGLFEIIMTPLLIILLCILGFVVFNRIIPRLCSIMNGGRIFNKEMNAIDLLKHNPILLYVVSFIYNIIYSPSVIKFYIWGNGSIKGAFLKRCKIQSIKGGRIEIKPKVLMNRCLCHSEGGGESVIRIEGGGTNIKNSSFITGMNCGRILIAGGFTSEGCRIKAHEGKTVRIGTDCMFSAGINISTTDFHAILNAVNGVRVNQAKDIVIGNHVWLAREVNILKGATVADNIIVGMGSTVTGPLNVSNSIYAGTPAKIVKEGVTWRRSLN